MPIRLARTTDLPRVSTILTDAFWHGDVLGDAMHPYREKYPEDFHYFWVQKVRKWYWDYTNQIVISYLEREKPGSVGQTEEVITGVAAWERQGEGRWKYGKLWGWWDPRNAIVHVVKFVNYVSLLMFPNRAADPKLANIIPEVFAHIRHYWSGKRAENWELNFLAIDPAFQSQGYGRDLTLWGVNQAKKENVATSVVAGTGKAQFYRKLGFDVEVGMATEGEGNPLKGLTEGGTIMFRDAEQSQTAVIVGV